MNKDQLQIREDASSHFLDVGDKVKPKASFDPHSSYDVVRGDLTRYAYGKLGNWMDAEDATQTAYVNTLRTARVNDFYNFGGLYKIWLDRAIGEIREQRNRDGDMFVEFQPEEVEHSVEQVEYSSPSGETLLEIQEKVDLLMSNSNRIPRQTKRIIRLSILFGYTNKEIASMLNTTQKRVKNAIYYFKKVYKEN